MKVYVALASGLAFGMVVGMLVPRDELLRLRREHRRATLSLSRCESGSSSAFGDLFSIAQPASAGPTPAHGDAPSDGGVASASVDGGVHEEVAVAEPAGEPAPVVWDGGVPEPSEDMGEAAAIDLRAHQARAALREQAGLDEAQMARLDTIVADMNAQLAERVRESVARGRANHGVVTRREMMELAADGLDILMLTDDRVRALVGSEAAAEVEIDAIDPTSFVSSEAFHAIEDARDLRIEGER